MLKVRAPPADPRPRATWSMVVWACTALMDHFSHTVNHPIALTLTAPGPSALMVRRHRGTGGTPCCTDAAPHSRQCCLTGKNCEGTHPPPQLQLLGRGQAARVADDEWWRARSLETRVRMCTLAITGYSIDLGCEDLSRSESRRALHCATAPVQASNCLGVL